METDVLEQYLEEELIHAVLHVYYGSMNNYEFEANVFRNIAGQWWNGGMLWGYLNISEDKRNEYNNWIKNIVQRKPLNFTSADLDHYFYFLSYTTLSGTTNMNQLPQLLLSLIINLNR